MFVRCPFCHKLVLRRSFEAHAAKHRKKRPDGQQQDHVTLAEPQRFTGSLQGVPQKYCHPQCGGCTGMPEEIVRTYLVNPMFYGDGSFCTGCNGYIDSADLYWAETGENVLEYTGKLRMEYLRRKYGMTIPDPATPVLITPLAAQQLNQKAAQTKLDPPWYLALAPNGRNFSSQFADGFDPALYVQSESAGVSIVLRRDQLEQMRGVAVEWIGGARGFNICRLWKPPADPQ